MMSGRAGHSSTFLGATAKKVAADAMLEELKHPSYVVRKRAANSLGGFKERRLVEPALSLYSKTPMR